MDQAAVHAAVAILERMDINKAKGSGRCLQYRVNAVFAHAVVHLHDAHLNQLRKKERKPTVQAARLDPVTALHYQQLVPEEFDERFVHSLGSLVLESSGWLPGNG